jgi:hypothetical protein
MKKELFKEYLREAKQEKDITLRAQKRECMEIANDFGYPQTVFNDILEATSIAKLNTVMHTAIQHI